MADIDPAIWQEFPTELLYHVIERCDRETLINWSCTNEVFYDFSSNLLWEAFQINGRDLADGLVARDIVSSRRLHKGLPLIQQKPAKKPLSRVQSMRFGFDDRLLEDPDYRDMCAQRVQILLNMMPELRRCRVEGVVYDEAWNHITDVVFLRSLHIRTQNEYVEFGGRSGGYEWAQSQVLDLRRIAMLSHLTNLSIGRLATKEAQGLAEAVGKLPCLSSLSISAVAFADKTDRVRSIFAGMEGESPIFELLAALWKIMKEAGPYGPCIPLTRSLKHLRLSDMFRTGQRQVDHDHLLIDTIQQYQNLSSLDLNIVRPKVLQSFFCLARLPALEHFSVAGCHHLVCEEDWARMGADISEVTRQTSTSTASTFKDFLRRHKKTLSSVTLNSAFWPSQRHPDSNLIFSSKDLDCLLGPKAPPTKVIRLNWLMGHWYSCSEYALGCIETTRSRRLTLG
ncbi:MAG: hypothetical protein Q9168_007939 [Polycauliona sp. 1 TL-2023]